MREQRPDLAESIQGSSGGGVFVDSLGGKQGGGGGVGKLEKGGGVNIGAGSCGEAFFIKAAWDAGQRGRGKVHSSNVSRVVGAQ